jgi:asparagine synthase (glutamine-hydrolysing)
MSAITGIFYRDGRKVDRKLIQQMNDRLSHRGPDGSALWYDGSIAFGHQMLQTTPESLHEKLPYHEHISGLVITADARIDNRSELSIELDIKDEKDVSDSYFILKAYEKWGEQCPEYLLGDFAFAIWDENNERLFCARDHMGVKPLYYYSNDDMFVFGTEIKALFCVPGVPREVNETRIALYLLQIRYFKAPYRFTFYENIFSLPPANSLTINRKKTKTKKYWELNEKSEIIMDSEEEYVNKFRELFREAVQCRLRSAYPVGFQLSGGLDSSSVICMAKEIFKEKGDTSDINSFSYVFDEIPCDERYYIQKVVDTGGINPNFVLSDEIHPMENIEKVLWYQEQPESDIYIAIVRNLYKKMQEKNIRIVLGGYGGDQVVSHGKKYFRDLTVQLKLKKLISELYSYSKNKNLNFYKLFINTVLFPLIPAYIKKPIYSYFNISYDNSSEISILNREFAKRMKADKYLEELSLRPKIEYNTAKQAHYKIITKYNVLGLENINSSSSAFCIEHRHPFFDKRLLEFCYAIPTEIKFRSGWNRYILRKSMENILPKENQWRADKMNFTPYYERNLLLFEKDRLDEFIYPKNKNIEKYVEINMIKKVYEKYEDGTADSSSIFWLWLVSILSLWAK